MDRVRGFVRLYPPQMCLAAGEIVADGTPAAPYFEFLVLAGRPLEQRQTLLAAFTDLIVEHLGSPCELVRGRAIEVEPASAGVVRCAPAPRPTSEPERASRCRRSDRRGRRCIVVRLRKAGVPVVAVARDRDRLEQLSATDDGITACPADIGDDSSGEAIAAGANRSRLR